MASSSLNLLPHSTTSPKYLESNSTSHVWVFGAVAELIDNSMDAGATQLSINVDHSIKDGPALVFIDNGKGMQTQGLHHMLSFGHCNKSEEEIGRYGNGFKSGSMRIGRDALVFSKSKGTLSLGFLSQTFLKAIKAPEVFVPIVSWDATTSKVKSDSVSGHKSSSSLEVILKYSPFKTSKELLNTFGKIKSPSGTCIIIYNLKKQEDEDDCHELDFDDKHDIKLKVTQMINVPQEQISLRAYCAILYLNPTMNIDIRGERVQTVRISSTLLESIQYTYAPKNVESVYQNVSHPVIFGFVPREELKHHYGVMMYNKNRLIKGYVHVGPQLINTHSQGKYIVGVIEANWLQPTHNKQDFFLGQNFAKQYELLIIALGEKLKIYLRDVGIQDAGIGKFTRRLWNPVIDISKSKASKGKKATKSKKKKNDDESDEEEEEEPKEEGGSIRARLRRKTRQNIEPGVKRVAVTCASCLKWRLVPEKANIPADWTCEDNSDTRYNTCSAPQEDPECEIPKAPKRKDYSLIPLDKQIEDMLDEIDQTRTQFAKKDRIKEKKLFGLMRMQDEDEYPPPTYGEEIVGKKVYIYWRTHDEWFQGKIAKFIESKGTHQINYKDGDEEEAYLDDQWLYFPDSSIPSNIPPIEVTGTKAVFPVGNPLVAKKKNANSDSLDHHEEKGVNANKARRGRDKKRAVDDKKRKRSPSPETITKKVKDDKSAAFSAMETELATLRATVKKFMQLSNYNVEVPDENLVSTFSNHVNNIENNINNVNPAITYPSPSLSESPIYIPPSPTISPPSTAADSPSTGQSSSDATFFTFL